MASSRFESSMPSRCLPVVLCLLLALVLTGCPRKKPVDPVEHGEHVEHGELTEPVEQTIAEESSSDGLFEPRRALVITDNDEAFASKLRMVENASSTIDLMYFIYHDDYSSAVFAEALLAAAARGVKVRWLLDYSSNYRYLDLLTAMEAEAAGPGSLEVRFYNRPTRQIIRDVSFMTMGCAELGGEEGPECDAGKLEAIDRALAEEGLPSENNVSNLNLGNSGLFLSGFYARNPEVMAFAVTKDRPGLKQALAARLATDPGELKKQLAAASPRGKGESALLNQTSLTPLKAALKALLPPNEGEGPEPPDWDYVTDFLHQKVLLADSTKFQFGGRNIGDSYHMRPGPLLGDHYLYSDTDVYVEMAADTGGAIRDAFDRMWGFERMIATTAEVRQHAPNDFIAARAVAVEACSGEPESERQACVEQGIPAGFRSAEQRMAAAREELRGKAAKYREAYAQTPTLENPGPTLEIDSGARMAYLENLPFSKALAAGERTRIYGAAGVEEADDGKHIHNAWRLALEQVCAEATAEAPGRVILHHAYYLPSGNLLRSAGRMVDGSLDCRHVKVQVLTNSEATTDFLMLNPLAHHGLKAFSDFKREGSDAEKQAAFEFYEYRPKPEPLEHFSLHSKVSILGEDLIIGSANADVRSYMMDSNNGMWITGADGFRQRYTELVDRQLADPEVASNLGDFIRSVSREDLKAAHMQAFRAQLDGKLGARLTDGQKDSAVKLLGEALDAVYELTLAVLHGDEAALDEYNRKFKVL